MKRRFIILAGGSGQRLWPLSTAKRPKPLIPFLSDATLLEQTIDRLAPLQVTKDELVIVTQKQHTASVYEVVQDRVATIISEPCGRNTAPALLYALLSMAQLPSDTIIVILPADHFIPDETLFSQVLARAIEYTTANDQLALIGVKPTRPDTGYGYIAVKPGEAIPLTVARFHEKPDQTTAQRYQQQNNVYWNSGMCVASKQTLWNAFLLHQPLLIDAMAAVGIDASDYADLPARSFDHAILEKSINTVLFPFEGEWYDIGTLETFLMLEQQYGRRCPAVEIEGSGNIVRSSKQVVLFGVNDLCIVETDTALLVTPRSNTEKLRVIHEYFNADV